jgi:pimeloyl-ACP methyl ester carboxylesterase
MLHHVEAGALVIAYDEHGSPRGWPVVLLHGFPYDIHAYDDVALRLAAAGARVIVPFLRGYGPTRFASTATPRSGQQAALGVDLLALLDALQLPSALLGGFDWGGRAACVAAALRPERVAALVSVNGYTIQDIAAAGAPASPEAEHRYWYQYYFHGERGRLGLAKNRRAFCRLLWRLWSLSWRFDDATFERSAAAFDNPDFVDVVIHSYRHRFGLCAGDPALDDVELALASQPPIRVPTITLDGSDDGVVPAQATAHRASRFTGRHEHRVVEGAGHDLPQEAPQAFAQAVLDLRAGLQT